MPQTPHPIHPGQPPPNTPSTVRDRLTHWPWWATISRVFGQLSRGVAADGGHQPAYRGVVHLLPPTGHRRQRVGDQLARRWSPAGGWARGVAASYYSAA